MKVTLKAVVYACVVVLMLASLCCDLNARRKSSAWKPALEKRELPEPELYDAYGGWKGIQSDASGFFRVELLEGALWLVTPEGNGFISKGVNAFWCPAAREAETVAWLQGLGFNSLGAWSSTGKSQRIVKARIPYAELLNLLKSYASIKGPRGKTWPDMFSDKFAESMRKQVEEKVKPLASDPYLIGWWTDNELRWASENPPLLDAYLELPSDAPGRRAAEGFLAERYSAPTLPKDREQLERARDGFVEFAVRHYAEVTTQAIRELDENHLILGCRIFFTPVPWNNIMPERLGGLEAIARGAKGYWDVLSVNAYFDETPTYRFRKISNVFQGPILISEFNVWSAKEDRGRSGEEEWTARAQVSIEGCSEQLPALIAEPYVVGYHYFPFSNYAAPRENNSRAGLVNFEGEPRKPLTEALRSINLELEEIHQSGISKE